MSTDSAFNGYGYLSPYADTCFYRDEKKLLFENCHNLFIAIITKSVYYNFEIFIIICFFVNAFLLTNTLK